MTNEEIVKVIVEMQTMLNNTNKAIEDINKQYEENQQSITDLMKINNELMLSVSSTKENDNVDIENEKLESKLLGDYSSHFDDDTLSDFINKFEGE